MFLLTLQSLHFSDMIATASLHILQRVFALSAPGFYYNHDSNTSSPKRWIISDLIWDRMLLHPPKAPLSIVVTLLGIMMLTSDPHPQKAPFSIQVTLFGILMLVRQEQLSNVLLVDYQYYTLKTVEKWQNRFCVDTKNVRFNVFNFWLHQNHIDMDWMGAFEPTP